MKLAIATVVFVALLVQCAIPAGAAQMANYIYTVAGTGAAGYAGDGGVATSATMNSPVGLAIDSSGNIYVADTLNYVVREIAAVSHVQFGISMTAGDIYTIAGDGISGYTGDGGPALSAEINPWGVYVDPAGNLIIAEEANNRIREVAASNETQFGIAMTANDIYTIAGNGTSGYTGVGGPATSAEIGQPNSVTEDASGDLFLSQIADSVVEEVPSTTKTQYGQAMIANYIYNVAGNGTTGFSGDGSVGSSAQLNYPCEVSLDASGDIFIADAHNNRVREVAAVTGTQYGIPMTPNDIYTVAGNGTLGYSGDGGVATSAELDQVTGVLVDSKGNLYLADYGNNRVREVAATTSTQFGVAMTANDIYTIAGTGTGGNTGNGGPALSAELDNPGRVVMDAGGDIFVTNESSNIVSEIAAYSNASLVSTMSLVAGSLSFTSAPGNVTFMPLVLSGLDQVTTATETIDIADATGSGAGWNITLSNTLFTSGSQHLANSDFTAAVPTTDTCDVGVTCMPATLSSSFTALPGSTATKLMSAAAGTGMADQTVTIAWSAAIPASSFAGNYASTWTLTLVAGP
ncbi:MAG: hypothetical protein ACP5OR_03045 [Candidatus Dormibacteria bacterium]